MKIATTIPDYVFFRFNLQMFAETVVQHGRTLQGFHRRNFDAGMLFLEVIRASDRAG